MNAVIGMTLLALTTTAEGRDYVEGAWRRQGPAADPQQHPPTYEDETGHLELEVPITPETVVEQMTDMLGHDREKGPRAALTASRDLPSLVGDLPAAQVLVNLGSNAIKFTENNVTISLEHRRRHRLTYPHGWVRTPACGNATAEQQAQLFRPFTQTDNSSCRRFSSTRQV